MTDDTQAPELHPGQREMLDRNNDEAILQDALPTPPDTETAEDIEAERQAELERTYGWSSTPEVKTAVNEAIRNLSRERVQEGEESDFYLPLSKLAENPQSLLDEFIDLNSRELLPPENHSQNDKLILERLGKLERAFYSASHDPYYKTLLATYIETFLANK